MFDGNTLVLIAIIATLVLLLWGALDALVNGTDYDD